MVDTGMNEAPEGEPIACTLEGDSYKQRIAAIRALFARALKHSRRDGGHLHLTFDAAAASEVQDFIDKERACCAFLDFQLSEGDGVVKLIISVPPNAVDAAGDLLEPFNSRA